MTARITIQVKDLSPAWVANIKEKYPNQAIEVKVMPSLKEKLLDEDLFWEIIGLFDWSKSDNEATLAPAIDRLATYPVHYIYLFQDMLAEKLFQLDAKKYALHIGEDAWVEDQYFSVDQFLYARCCVVANGKTVYYSVLEKPSSMPKEVTFEPILSIAKKAHELKTGEKFQYFPVRSYETYSNQEGWKH